MNRYGALCLTIILAIAGAVRADHLSDLRDLHHERLPAVALWNVNGFTVADHVRYVQNGHRVIPSVPLPAVANATAAQAAKVIAPYPKQWEFLREHRLPVVLRHNNLGQAFTVQHYRLPLVPENVARSPLVWWIDANGVLNDRPWPDMFGAVDHWRAEGLRFGQTAYLNALIEAHPTPAWTLITDNNEAGIEKPFTFVRPGIAWRSLDELARINLRVQQHVADRGVGSDPWPFMVEFYRRRQERYGAFFSAFAATLPDGWSNLYSEGYSAGVDAKWYTAPQEVRDATTDAPEGMSYDAYGTDRYLEEKYLTSNLLDGAHVVGPNLRRSWNISRERNPRAFRVVFMHISSAAVLAPAKAGKHGPITPDVWGQYAAWLAWQCRPGPVLLHHWCASTVRPSDAFFSPERQAELEQFGVGHLATATQETYIRPIMQAVNRICESETLRRFWCEGGETETRLVGRAWVTTVRLGDETLVYCWSPDPVGELTVAVEGFGDVTLPGAGYFVIRRNQGYEVRSIE